MNRIKWWIHIYHTFNNVLKNVIRYINEHAITNIIITCSIDFLRIVLGILHMDIQEVTNIYFTNIISEHENDQSVKKGLGYSNAILLLSVTIQLRVKLLTCTFSTW